METASTIAAINETTGLAPAAGGVVMLETALIDPNPANPRRDVGDVGELADSIRAQGIRQNLLVVPAPEGRFTLVIGHRPSAAGGRETGGIGTGSGGRGRAGRTGTARADAGREQPANRPDRRRGSRWLPRIVGLGVERRGGRAQDRSFGVAGAPPSQGRGHRR